MENPQDRVEIGRRVGAVSAFTVKHSLPMLSSIVVRKGESVPGSAFYELAIELGLLAPGEEKDRFAIGEMKRTWAVKMWPEAPA